MTNTASLLTKETVSPVKLLHERQVSTTDTSTAAITPIYRLYGHDDTVVCLHANTDLDVLLSGSTDGTVIIWNLRRGCYLRSLPVGHAVEHVAISCFAQIVAASRHTKPRQIKRSHARSKSTESSPATSPPTSPAVAKLKPPAAPHHQRSRSGTPVHKTVEEDYFVTLWTINGVKLAERSLSNQVTALLITSDAKYLFVGTTGGVVLVFNLSALRHPLHLLHTFTIDERPPNNAVRTLAFVGSEQYLLVGVESGSVLLFPLHQSDWLK